MSNDNKTLADAQPGFTTGHCQNNKQLGGCQLHNLQCGWPNCDRKAVEPSLADAQPGGRVRLGDRPKEGEVLVEVSGLTGSGKSAVAGEIEILCKALGLDAEWVNGDEEKRLTHADWIGALEMYKPKVVIVERNIPRAALSAQPSPGGQDAFSDERVRWFTRAGAYLVRAQAAEAELANFDRFRATSRRQSAVEFLLNHGFIWDGGHWKSRQPSPGGQDALATARELLAAEYDKAGERVFADRARKGQYDNDPDVHAIVTALAARQPVGISADWVLGYLTTDAPEDSREAIRNAFTEYAALSAARQPSKQPDSVALGEATEFCIEKGDRQPVGEPVARLIEAVEGECDGLAISTDTATAILAHVYPLGQTPVAYMVDGRVEQGLFFDRTAAENMAAMNAGEAVPLFRESAQAVDLGGMPEGWRLSKKATCYQLSHGNDIIGNLVGPDAEENAAIIARVLDSQAVGK